MMNKTNEAKENKAKKNKREWFEEWFDSTYYHTLYKYRDETEAEGFIDHLLEVLQPPVEARILDLACGKGRYSRYLAEKGFEEVVGLDLSIKSIEHARQFENDNLSFFTHDMRLPFRINYFDYIFNFFTSFGYFDSEKDDLKTLQSIAKGLKPTGTFVLDFFNSRYVTDRLTGWEEKIIDGIQFRIDKQIEKTHIIKTIEFEDEGKRYFFRERVRLFFEEDFQRLFAKAGLQIIRTFGDYQLNPFDEKESPRLILVAEKMR